MSNQIEFTVVIPVFNRRHLVARAVDSVLAQTYPVKEIIIVDDGSTDGVGDYIAERYSGTPFVRCLRQENQGPGIARNLGVRNAKTDWVAFLDSDDEWYAFRLERVAEALTQCPSLDALVTGMDQDVRSVLSMPLGVPPVSEPYTVEHYLMSHGLSCCMVLRREWFCKIDGFRSMKEHEDHDLVLRLISAGGAFAVLRESLGLIHTEESGHSRSLVEWYGNVFAFWENMFRQYGLRGLKRRRALASLLLDNSISAWEKGASLLSLIFLLRSFVWMPFPLSLSHYGRRLRYIRLLYMLLQTRMWSSMVRCHEDSGEYNREGESSCR